MKEVLWHGVHEQKPKTGGLWSDMGSKTNDIRGGENADDSV